MTRSLYDGKWDALKCDQPETGRGDGCSLNIQSGQFRWECQACDFDVCESCGAARVAGCHASTVLSRASSRVTPHQPSAVVQRPMSPHGMCSHACARE